MNDFDKAALDYFIARGRGGTVREIAHFSGLPLNDVKKAVKSRDYNCDKGLGDRAVWVASRSRNVWRKAVVFTPTIGMLRNEIIRRQEQGTS